MKYYVVADPHSFFTPMKQALDQAGFFSDCAPHKLIILGDLFDRGLEAQDLQAFVLDLMSQDEVILIRGNHEDLLLELIGIDCGIAYKHHRSNGTFDTALQLTGFDPIMATIRHYDFAEAVKETPLCREIIPAMKDYFETKRHIFVHGWIPCIREKDGSYSFVTEWRNSSELEWMGARWINGMAAAADGVTEAGKTIVCGHWHTSFGHSTYEGKGSQFDDDADFSPYHGKGIIALDACTGHSGIVNCIVLEDDALS